MRSTSAHTSYHLSFQYRFHLCFQSMNFQLFSCLRTERISWIQLNLLFEIMRYFYIFSLFFVKIEFIPVSIVCQPHTWISQIFRLISYTCALRNIPLLIFIFSVHRHQPSAFCMWWIKCSDQRSVACWSTNTCYEVFIGIMLQFSFSSFSLLLFTRYHIMENQHQ